MFGTMGTHPAAMPSTTDIPKSSVLECRYTLAEAKMPSSRRRPRFGWNETPGPPSPSPSAPRLRDASTLSWAPVSVPPAMSSGTPAARAMRIDAPCLLRSLNVPTAAARGALGPPPLSRASRATSTGG